MRIRETLSALAVVSLLVNPLAAMAQGGKQTMVVWYALKAPYGDQFATMVKGYEATHPYLDVQTRNFDDPDALRSALSSSGAQPDVALIDAAWQDELIAGQRLIPMEDLMNGASNMARIVCKADTFAPLFQLSLREGKLWTLPTFCSDTALIYNPKMFTAKKITKLPNTWGDLLTDAKKLNDPNNGVWGFQLPIMQSGTDMGHLFSVMLWQMGADLTNLEDPSPASGSEPAPPAPMASPAPPTAMPSASPASTGPATAPAAPGPTPAASPALSPAVKPATPAASPAPSPAVKPATPAASPVAAPVTKTPAASHPAPSAAVLSPSERLMTFLIDMVYKYKVSPAQPTDDPTKVAMMFGTPETLLTAEAKGVTLNAAPFPMNKIKVSEMALYNYAITRDAHDPKEAYQFTIWCAGFEQAVVWATSTPYLPANRQVTLCPQYFQYLGQHPGLKAFIKEMGVGRLQPLVPHYHRVMTETNTMVNQAISTHEDAGDAVHALVDKTRYIMTMPRSSTDTTQIR